VFILSFVKFQLCMHICIFIAGRETVACHGAFTRTVFLLYCKCMFFSYLSTTTFLF
jgi:hypothetical protein